MTDWNIQTRAHACQQCGKAFADKEPYHTVLSEDQVAYIRRDYCADCWLRERDRCQDKPQRAISHWQGVYELPPPPSELIRKETAETLLAKLIERGDPRYGGPMFILAVMLERKRLLKVKDQIRREGCRTLVYERPKTGEVLMITDPELGVDQLEQVQRDVSYLLEHGLSEPGAELDAEGGTPPPGGTSVEASSEAGASAETDSRHCD